MSRLIESTLTGKISKILVESEGRYKVLRQLEDCFEELNQVDYGDIEGTERYGDMRPGLADQERINDKIRKIVQDNNVTRAEWDEVFHGYHDGLFAAAFAGLDYEDFVYIPKHASDEDIEKLKTESDDLEDGKEKLFEEEKDYEVVHADSDVISDLENGSAFTFEGLETSDESLSGLVDFLKNEANVGLKTPVVIFTWTGKEFNDKYGLTGSNAYPDDLTFVSIGLDSFEDIGRLAMVKMQVGARWLDDIVDNNARREGYNESVGCDPTYKQLKEEIDHIKCKDKKKLEDKIGELKQAIEDGVSEDEKAELEKEIADLESQLEECNTKLKESFNQRLDEWAGKINSGSELRKLLNSLDGETPEECKQVLDALKKCCEEAIEICEKKNIDEYYKNGFQSVIDDIEMIYDDEDLDLDAVNWELDGFYDWADSARLWVNLNEPGHEEIASVDECDKTLKEEYVFPDVNRLKKEVESAVLSTFEGSDFEVYGVEIPDAGKVTFEVVAYGNEPDENGDTEMSREVTLYVPELNYYDAVVDACEEWKREHSGPDSFYESDDAKKRGNESIDELNNHLVDLKKIIDEEGSVDEELLKAKVDEMIDLIDGYKEEMNKSLNESYSEKLGGEPEDFIHEVEEIRYALENIHTNTFATKLAAQMVEDFIDTCDNQIKMTKDRYLKESAEGGIAFWEKGFKPGDKIESSGAGEVELIDLDKGADYVLLKRNSGYQPYVAAWAPSLNDEGKLYWGQGHYYSDENEAKEYFNSKKLNESVMVTTDDGSTVDMQDAASVSVDENVVSVTNGQTTVTITSTPDLPVEEFPEEPVQEEPVEEVPVEELVPEEPIEEVPVEEPIEDEVVEESIEEPENDESVIETETLNIIKNQGDVYMLSVKDADGTEKFWVCENFNQENNEGEEAAEYDNQEEANDDYFNRVGLIDYKSEE